MNSFEYMPVTKLPTGLYIPEENMIDEEALNQDVEYLKSMYPAKAKIILALVEDRCDRLEYDGSPMFVEYPDKETILKIAKEILRMVCQDDVSETEKTMLCQLTEVMVLSEVSVRRGRYKRRKKYF